MKRFWMVSVLGVMLVAFAVLLGLSTTAPAQAPALDDGRAEFHKAAFLAALSDTSAWMDSDFGATYLSLIQEEGYTTEQMHTFLTTFPPAMALDVADASTACYFDGECEWNVRHTPWPLENPDYWYSNIMDDPEVWCKFWPDHIPMWPEVFWTCLDAGGVSAALTCNTMVESNQAGMSYEMWQKCWPYLGW